jgi:hypothetical protein
VSLAFARRAGSKGMAMIADSICIDQTPPAHIARICIPTASETHVDGRLTGDFSPSLGQSAGIGSFYPVSYFSPHCFFSFIPFRKLIIMISEKSNC